MIRAADKRPVGAHYCAANNNVVGGNVRLRSNAGVVATASADNSGGLELLNIVGGVLLVAGACGVVWYDIALDTRGSTV